MRKCVLKIQERWQGNEKGRVSLSNLDQKNWDNRTHMTQARDLSSITRLCLACIVARQKLSDLHEIASQSFEEDLGIKVETSDQKQTCWCLWMKFSQFFSQRDAFQNRVRLLPAIVFQHDVSTQKLGSSSGIRPSFLNRPMVTYLYLYFLCCYTTLVKNIETTACTWHRRVICRACTRLCGACVPVSIFLARVVCVQHHQSKGINRWP